jgi:8-oxo-dGTP diphosphatase
MGVHDHAKPLVAVDVAAFTVLDADLKLLLIRRGLPPEGSLALPGGFVRCAGRTSDATEAAPGRVPGEREVKSPGDKPRRRDGDDQGEDLEDAARRELFEETRLPAPKTVPLVQVHVFGAPDRDPRARVISVAYLAVVKPEVAAYVRAGSDAAGVLWWSVADLDKVTLAFDHRSIVDRCLERLRRDVDETAIARALVPEAFSVAELRAAVEAVRGTRADPGNFRRRFERLVEDNVVVRASGKRVTTRRPAAVYEFRS